MLEKVDALRPNVQIVQEWNMPSGSQEWNMPSGSQVSTVSVQDGKGDWRERDSGGINRERKG